MTSASSGTATTVDQVEDFRRLSNERIAAAPVGRALGMTIAQMTTESLRVEAPVPRIDFRPSPIGLVSVMTALTDTAAGMAAATGPTANDVGATIELRMDYAAPIDPAVRWLRAEGRRLHTVGEAVLTAAVLTDERGTVLVRGTGHFARSFEMPTDVEPPAPAPTGALMEAMSAALTLGPSADPAERTVPLAEVLANWRGHIHGGMVLALAEQVQRAIHTLQRAQLRSLHAEYLRPMVCDGGPLICRSAYVRNGRRFATLRTEMIRADGRPAAIATGLWAAGGTA